MESGQSSFYARPHSSNLPEHQDRTDTDMTTICSITHTAFAATLAIALAACNDEAAPDGSTESAAIAAIPAPQGTEWVNTVVVTEMDGYRVGNPDAPVKLIEYASLTCGACAAFAESGAETLRDQYINSGVVSWEVRNQIHGPDDLVLSRIVRCGQPESYHPLSEQVWANLQGVLGPVYANQEVMQQTLTLPEDQRFVAFAEQGGFLDFFAARGISRDQARQCLADSASLQTIAENSQKQSKDLNVDATPTFIINGNNVGTQNWSSLEPMLQNAGAR